MHNYFPANEEDGVNLLFICQFSKIWPKVNKQLKNKVQIILEVKEGHIKWCANKETYQKAGREVLKKLIDDPKYIKQVKEKTKKAADAFINFSKKIQQTALTKLTNQQIIQLINKHDRLYLKMAHHGILPAIVEVPFGQFNNYLTELLNNKFAYFKTKKLLANYFQSLTQINHLDSAKSELIDRLKIASQIKAKKDLTKEKFQKLIKQHTEKYFWINYAYQGPILKEKDFIKEILDDLKTKPKQRLQKLLKERQNTDKNRSKTITELKLTAKEKQIFISARESIFIKIYRKDALTYSLAIMEKMLKEISRRTNYNLTQIRHCLTKEIPLLFKNQKLKTELNKRIKHMVYYLKDNKLTTPVIITGLAAKKFMDKVLVKETHGELTEFTGACACPGKARGKVKIINVTKDMAKMNKGDILVSIATIPEIVPAMKKSAAIVTDIGGITSHAAIVSRELKTPCVIGTQKATKILKDGDLVEVDAERGIVKKI